MTKTLLPGTYIQLNTDDSNFLIQNQSEYDCHIVVSDTAPLDNTAPDIVLETLHGVSSSHLNGICWGKPDGKYSISVGVVEG